MKQYNIISGEIKVTDEDCCITTVLGSCVSVCLFDIDYTLGGVCHFALPKSYDENKSDKSLRYAEFAIISMLKKFKQQNIHPKNIRAKIVGRGAPINDEDNSYQVGKKNVESAIAILNRFKIKVDANSTDGTSGRQIRFFPHLGELQVKKIVAKTTATNTPTNIVKESTTILPKQTRKTKRVLKILIVDDSRPVRMLLRRMVEANSNFEVCGEAENGIQALEHISKDRPDVITLDLNMPQMGGLEFLKSFMETNPIPTIIVSALSKSDSNDVFTALEIGAFDYIKKPAFTEFESVAKDLHETIIDAYASTNKKRAVISNVKVSTKASADKLKNTLIVLGASTGGTEAIKALLTKLPRDIPPIAIVQHIPPVFSEAFAKRLNELCAFNVKEAAPGDVLIPGQVVVAPGGKHLKLKMVSDKIVTVITSDEPVNRFRPSVDYLFNSVENIKIKNVIGVLLTGMGSDGAKGMLKLKNNKGYTIAQDEESSTVYGMPKVAKELGGVSKVLPLDKIADEIMNQLK